MMFNSLDSEKAVIGGLLIEPCFDRVVSTRLTNEDFSNNRLGYIFTSMLEMFRKKKPIDIVTVRDYIDKDKLNKNLSIGPILLGLAYPVHVLQLDASVDEIVNMAAIAVIDAQKKQIK